MPFSLGALPPLNTHFPQNGPLPIFLGGAFMAWGGAGGPPARAHPVFGRFLKKKLYSFGLTVDPDRDDSLAKWCLCAAYTALSTHLRHAEVFTELLLAMLLAPIRILSHVGAMLIEFE